MTYQEAVSHATAALTNTSDSPAFDARILFCHACKIEQTTVLAHPEKILSNQEKILYNKLIKRRNKGEPIAYITGEQEFWSLKFIVNPHVLIPRPETELLVETTLKIISNMQAPNILDLGTGSGAIAICIAKENSNCSVFASDFSLSALETARKNAARHEVEVTFMHSDWYKSLNGEKFDLIVSNPPYVAKNDPNLSQYVTKNEPNIAVISKENGLHDIESIIKHATQYLNSSGYLLIEHGFEQKLAVQQFFQHHGFKQVQTHKDLSGKDRVTYGCV